MGVVVIDAKHDAWFRRQVQVGIDAVNAGDVMSIEDVEAEAAAWRAETRRQIICGESDEHQGND